MTQGWRTARRPALRALGLLCVLAGLGGCGSLLTEGTADVAGIGGAATANALTKNATVATGIGLGVQSAAMAGLKYAERRIHRTEQDQIALVAGSLGPGKLGHWQVTHDVPIEDDEQGSVTVTRLIGTGPLNCKEIVFSVDDKSGRAFYTATVCKDAATWKWATAEPATERWGTMQ